MFFTREKKKKLQKIEKIPIFLSLKSNICTIQLILLTILFLDLKFIFVQYYIYRFFRVN